MPFHFCKYVHTLRAQSHENTRRDMEEACKLKKASDLQLQTDLHLRRITNNTFSVGLHTHSDGKGIPPETTAKATLPSTKGHTF